MRPSTLISFWTLFSFSEFAKFRTIHFVISAFVLDRMIVIATLMIMRNVFPLAVQSFEILQIQMPDDKILAGLGVRPLNNHEVAI